MKKSLLLSALILTIASLNAQVTDTGDKVGIGISSPQTKLHVKQTSSLSAISGNPEINLLNIGLKVSDGFVPENT